MNKQEYLESIRSRISAMPADDVNRFMDYYSEMIDDRPFRGGGCGRYGIT